MKKHLQFNDITALSLGWRAARRKAEKERRVEREKEQSSSSLLCIFIKENITSFPPLVLFSFSLCFFCLTHFHLPLSPLFSLLFTFTSPSLLHCPALIAFHRPVPSPLFPLWGLHSSIGGIQFSLKQKQKPRRRSSLSANVSFWGCVVLQAPKRALPRNKAGGRARHLAQWLPFPQICSWGTEGRARESACTHSRTHTRCGTPRTAGAGRGGAGQSGQHRKKWLLPGGGEEGNFLA